MKTTEEILVQDRWDRKVEVVGDAYNDRALALLRRIADLCTLPHDEPDQAFGDDFRWSMCVYRPGRGDLMNDRIDDCVDVTVQLDDSQAYEGTYEGVTFSLRLVHASGQLVGSIAPYNYTPQVWVAPTNAEAVEARFALVEQADVPECVQVIREWFEKNPRKEG